MGMSKATQNSQRPKSGCSKFQGLNTSCEQVAENMHRGAFIGHMNGLELRIDTTTL